MGDYDGISSEVSRELDGLYPDGWDVADTRADADKLYAGGITAVNRTGEVWLDHNRYLSEEEAQDCLKIVKDWIDRKAGPGWEPALHEPGFHSESWTVALEGVYLKDEWPWLISQDKSVKWPEGVRVEAGSGWYLCLIRD